MKDSRTSDEVQAKVKAKHPAALDPILKLGADAQFVLPPRPERTGSDIRET